MSIESNKAVVRRLFEEVLAQRRLDLLDEIVADDVVLHTPVPGLPAGRPGFSQWMQLFISAFPQQHTDVHALIGEGELVTVRHTHHATHAGEFMGLPPTGRTIAVHGIEIYRLAEGRIAEAWHHDDMLALFTQLGIIPAPTVA